MVLDAVNEMHRHVTADQIYTFVKEKYPSIGRGTVYRNLGILVKEGKVRKVEVPDGSDRFDFTLENHYHVECVKCGEIFDVDMDVISELEKRIRDTHGMKYISHDIFLRVSARNVFIIRSSLHKRYSIRNLSINWMSLWRVTTKRW
jgi:Fe2+ or Zn2+ uptake regulation protein